MNHFYRLLCFEVLDNKNGEAQNLYLHAHDERNDSMILRRCSGFFNTLAKHTYSICWHPRTKLKATGIKTECLQTQF